jgi:hypothetical protein
MSSLEKNSPNQAISLEKKSSNQAISLFLFSTILLTEINNKANNIYSGLPPDEESDMLNLKKQLDELKK